MGCYELLSAPCHPSSLPPPPPHRASVAPPAATLSGLAEGRLPPPITHVPPIAEFKNNFQRPRPKARMASIWRLKSVAAEFGQLL